jgi:uncharacterized protein with von Willebrand factor type A (vWA) domain
MGTSVADIWDDEPSVPQPRPTERTKIRSVERDVYDKAAWDQLLGTTPEVQRAVNELALFHPTSPPAYEDVFNLLYRASPRFEAEREMHDAYRPQWSLIEALSQSDDFGFLRKFTTHDQYFTVKALIDLEEPLQRAFDELAQRLEDEAPFCPWPPPEGQPQDGGEASEDEGEGASEGPVQVPGDALAQLAHAVHKVVDDVEEEEALMEAYGIEPGTLQRLDYAKRAALVKEFSEEKARDLAKLLGQWRPFAGAERRKKIVHAPSEFVGYTSGNDLMSLAPEEYVQMALPELQDLFDLRFARHELTVELTRGVESAGQGPIIVVCDESQTMTAQLSPDGTTREMWSKALSLCMADQARRGGRDFIYMGFSSQSQVWVSTFVGGRGSLDQVVEFVGHFFNGGTHFERPLTEAIEIVERYERTGKPKPDILFLTDAACEVPPEFITRWREMRERADVKCYGVQIGGSPNSVMRSLVDRVISLTKLNASPSGMADLFRTI